MVGTAMRDEVGLDTVLRVAASASPSPSPSMMMGAAMRAGLELD
eukprot:ctg_5729.g606